MNNWLIYSVVESLQPTFAEHMDNTSYWGRYQAALEVIKQCSHSVVSHLNYEINARWTGQPEHHACVDVASTLQEIDPAKYQFKFN